MNLPSRESFSLLCPHACFDQAARHILLQNTPPSSSVGPDLKLRILSPVLSSISYLFEPGQILYPCTEFPFHSTPHVSLPRLRALFYRSLPSPLLSAHRKGYRPNAPHTPLQSATFPRFTSACPSLNRGPPFLQFSNEITVNRTDLDQRKHLT